MENIRFFKLAHFPISQDKNIKKMIFQLYKELFEGKKLYLSWKIFNFRNSTYFPRWQTKKHTKCTLYITKGFLRARKMKTPVQCIKFVIVIYISLSLKISKYVGVNNFKIFTSNLFRLPFRTLL